MPQLQVLPEAPSFGSELRKVLEKAAQNVGSGISQYYKNKQEKTLLDQIFGETQTTQTEQTGQPTVDPTTGQPVAEQPQQAQPIAQPKDKALQAAQNPRFMAQMAKDHPQLYNALQKNLENSMAQEKFNLEKQKVQNQENRAQRGETLKIRTKYAEDSTAAEKAIRNKKAMLSLVKKGDLTNPILAGVADKLPKGMGQIFLSTDSQLYKSMLFDEFGVLKQMFPGQIRTKELELLEDKLADLYKNKEAKEAIIETSLKKMQAEVIRGEAAGWVEKNHPNASILEFQKLVEQKAIPELQKLYDEIETDYKGIANKYGPKPKIQAASKGSTSMIVNGTVYNIPNNQLKDFKKDFSEAKKHGK